MAAYKYLPLPKRMPLHLAVLWRPLSILVHNLENTMAHTLAISLACILSKDSLNVCLLTFFPVNNS